VRNFTCTAASLTDVGRKRAHNEDVFLVDEELGVYLVADGMGGHACGEVAAALTADAFQRSIAENRDVFDGFRLGNISVDQVLSVVRDGILVACREVYDVATREPDKRGMGCTCTAAVIAGDHAFLAHVGDSRAYLVRDGRAVQLTRDHSVLNELVDLGELTAVEAKGTAFAHFRNTLARAVGVTAEVEVDSLAFEVLPGDALVFGSDGLFHYVPAKEIGEAGIGDPEEICAEFVERALERGGHDNITVVLARLDGPEEDETGVNLARELRRKIDTVANLPLFGGLSYRALIRVLSSAKVRAIPAGRVLFSQGEGGDALFVVLEGGVRLDRGGQTVEMLGVGGHFGEQSLVDQAPRSATATVLEATRLLVLPREDFVRLIRREPEIAVQVLWNVAQVFAQRLRHTTGKWEEATRDFTPDDLTQTTET